LTTTSGTKKAKILRVLEEYNFRFQRLILIILMVVGLATCVFSTMDLLDPLVDSADSGKILLRAFAEIAIAVIAGILHHKTVLNYWKKHPDQDPRNDKPDGYGE
jgi:hypothetical protein